LKHASRIRLAAAPAEQCALQCTLRSVEAPLHARGPKLQWAPVGARTRRLCVTFSRPGASSGMARLQNLAIGARCC
jgi:hypothetical protein